MSESCAHTLARIHGSGLPISGEQIELSLNAANGRVTYGDEPPAWAPRYIHACHEQRWSLATWKKAEPGDVSWRPARCCSWRHGGHCRRRKAAEDYARIKEALGRSERKNIVYAVLTLDPSAWTADGWSEWRGEGTRPRRENAVYDKGSIAQAYQALCERWSVFAKRLRREYESIEYVATVEVHRSGWPHLNVVLVCDGLADEVRAAESCLERWGRKAKGREMARRVLGDRLESAGFGPIAFIEPASSLDGDHDRLAAYIAKLAGEAGNAWDGTARGLREAVSDGPDGVKIESIEGQMVAEIAKYSQVPVDAPSHFRRLRSSKGFLPPKRRDETITGALFDENGRELGGSRTQRLMRAAMLADNPTAIQAVATIAGKLEERLGPKEKRSCDNQITRELSLIFAVLESKRAGKPVQIDPSPPPEHRGPNLAPMEKVPIRDLQTFADWIRLTGPGAGPAVRRYTLRTNCASSRTNVDC